MLCRRRARCWLANVWRKNSCCARALLALEIEDFAEQGLGSVVRFHEEACEGMVQIPEPGLFIALHKPEAQARGSKDLPLARASG